MGSAHCPSCGKSAGERVETRDSAGKVTKVRFRCTVCGNVW